MTRGKIFFISGPSGVGKGTVIAALRAKHPEWVFPLSCTTREPRPGEVPGETYHFISEKEFLARLERGDFLEYAQVHNGHYYGTLKEPLLHGIEDGKVVLREFDVQGLLSAEKVLDHADYRSIFLMPDGGIDLLVKRIRARAPITDEELEARIESMQKELALASHYDFCVTSYDNDVERIMEEIEGIIFSSLHL